MVFMCNLYTEMMRVKNNFHAVNTSQHNAKDISIHDFTDHFFAEMSNYKSICLKNIPTVLINYYLSVFRTV